MLAALTGPVAVGLLLACARPCPGADAHDLPASEPPELRVSLLGMRVVQARASALPQAPEPEPGEADPPYSQSTPELANLGALEPGLSLVLGASSAASGHLLNVRVIAAHAALDSGETLVMDPARPGIEFAIDRMAQDQGSAIGLVANLQLGSPRRAAAVIRSLRATVGVRWTPSNRLGHVRLAPIGISRTVVRGLCDMPGPQGDCRIWVEPSYMSYSLCLEYPCGHLVRLADVHARDADGQVIAPIRCQARSSPVITHWEFELPLAPRSVDLEYDQSVRSGTWELSCVDLPIASRPPGRVRFTLSGWRALATPAELDAPLEVIPEHYLPANADFIVQPRWTQPLTEGAWAP